MKSQSHAEWTAGREEVRNKESCELQSRFEAVSPSEKSVSGDLTRHQRQCNPGQESLTSIASSSPTLITQRSNDSPLVRKDPAAVRQSCLCP